MKLPKKQFVGQLKIREEVESLFLVKYIALQEAKDGRSYLNIVLGDSTGDLEGRVWQNADDFFSRIERNDFVTAYGKINFYHGKKQLIISQLEVVSRDEVNLDDFIAKAKEDPEVMFSELLSWVQKLDDVYIRDLLQEILSDVEITRRLKLWPAGKTIHHAYQSGLLEHILSCTRLSFSLSDFYQVNKNYVVAGAILHDICKIYELSEGLNPDYTDEGKLIGHLVKGLEILDRFSFRVKGFPYGMKLHLKHILLSHHGHLEFGSPKTPLSREAYLTHLIDYMDSKMASLETIKLADTNPGNWSSYIKHLDRTIYKSELPYYPEYVTEDEQPKKRKKPHSSQPLKHNLGDALKNFKS